MLSFTTSAFAVAGLLAAAGPILIHLLNRRRHRTVEWAAMDFLREALARSRRALQLRDLLLLALRVLAVVLLGLALARPFFSTAAGDQAFQTLRAVVTGAAALALAVWAVVTTRKSGKAIGGAACLGLAALAAWQWYGAMQARGADTIAAHSSRQPVHAVLLIDNSQSMGLETLGGNLLDRAKQKAREFVEMLPAESRISVVPVCGAQRAWSLDAYRTKDEAREALGRIEVVDLGGSAARVTRAIELAADACARVPELETKRVVYLSDQQVVNWPAEGLRDALTQIPELQIVQVAGESSANVWISEFEVQDGLADTQTAAVFRATVRHAGSTPQPDAQVTLSIDGAPLATQTVDLEPGQAQQLEFEHRLEVSVEPSRPTFILASVQIEPSSVAAVGAEGGDRLPGDNARHLAVPVVSGLPVVFVDQYGAQEDLDRGRVGETYRLRRLLAPLDTTDRGREPLIQVRHLTADELTVEALEDARLVVVAGVTAPGPAVSLLREYVLQGGRMVIAAGADFDPAAWNEQAWLGGDGILPAALAPQTVGQLPEETTAAQPLEPFFLSFDSLQHDEFFRIEQESLDVLRDLYRLPLFFKAVRVVVDDNGSQREPARAAASGEHRPEWLLWPSETRAVQRQAGAREEGVRSRPTVRARFAGSELPFLVERRFGAGRVLFVASGTYSSWNTLTQTSAVLVFDRMFRGLLEETLPSRTFTAGEPIAVPVGTDRSLQFTLKRPQQTASSGQEAEEILPVEALGPNVYGVSVRNALRSGAYLVSARKLDEGGDTAALSAETRQQWALAVNSPPEESDLRVLDEAALRARLGDANYRWIDSHEPISLEGAAVRGRDLWKPLATLALATLLLEMLVLGGPAFATRIGGPAA